MKLLQHLHPHFSGNIAAVVRSDMIVAVAIGIVVFAFPACRRSTPGTNSKSDGYYRLSLNINPPTLDPAHFGGVDADGVARRIFSTLVTLDGNMNIVPDLAERWEIANDGQTYTFYLREGVRFHNGRAMTAEDVRYSFERLLRKETVSKRPWVVEPIAGAKALRAGEADALAGLEVLSPRTVRITLEEPFPPFLSLLAMTNAAVLPREEVGKTDVPFGRRPIGTGPFRFVKWQDNHLIELARNDDYFSGPPALAGLRFRIIKEARVAYEEFKAGNLEHCEVPSGDLDRIRSGPEKENLRSVATLSTYFVGITMTREPAGSNVHLRRAMNYAIDREFLCDKVLGGMRVPARGVLPPGLPGYDPARQGYARNITRAKQELAEAGYGPNNPVPEMTLYCRNRIESKQVGEAIQNDLQQVGIPVVLRVLDFGALSAATNKAEPHLFVLSWMADYPDAENFLKIFHSAYHGAQGNRAHYTNGEVDRLFEASQRESDIEKRISLIREIENIVVADAPWIFLYHGQTHLLVQPWVQNFELGPMDVGTSVNRVDFHKVTLGDRAE